MNILDLPYEIKLHILGYCTQNDRYNLALCCKKWNSLANVALYSHIYISDEINLVQGFRCSNISTSCSVVYSDLNGHCSLKLLERTFKHSGGSIPYITTITCDDITFILFKLNSWVRKYPPMHRLNNFYFGNVSLNHFNIAYDDIVSFYRKNSLSYLHHLQITNLSDLITISKISRFNHLSLYLSDIKSVELSDFNKSSISQSNEEIFTKNLANVVSLEIVSTHNLSLVFLHKLYQLFGTQTKKLFPNCKYLKLNHTHGQTNIIDRFSFHSSYDISKECRLDFNIITQCFNVNRLVHINFDIGCNHIAFPSRNWTIEQLIDEQLDHCNCLAQFLRNFKFDKAQTLTITKSGQSLLVNPFSKYYFMEQIISNAKLFKRLPKLILDTKSSISHIFLNLVNNDKAKIWEIFRLQNERFFNAMGSSNKVEMPDYFENVFIFEKTSYSHDISQDNLKRISVLNCDCCDCINTNQMMMDFVNVNSQIQFYLSPITKKSFQQFYMELIETVLKISRGEFMNSSSKNYKGNKNDTVSSAQIMIKSRNNELANMVKQSRQVHNLLHTIFQHESYKELVNYNFVNDLAKGFHRNQIDKIDKQLNPFEIHCNCKGDELQRVLIFLEHQMCHNDRKHIIKN